MTVCVSSSDWSCAEELQSCGFDPVVTSYTALLQTRPANNTDTVCDAFTLPHEGALTDGGCFSSCHLKKETIRTESVLLSHWAIDWNISKCSRNCVVLYFFICVYWFVFVFYLNILVLKHTRLDSFWVDFQLFVTHLCLFTSHRLSACAFRTNASHTTCFCEHHS